MYRTCAAVAVAVLALTQSIPKASAALLSYTNNTFASSTPSDLYLSQFNTTLGTLLGVTVTIDSAVLQGSFSVTNNYNTTASISAVGSYLTVVGASNTLGYPHSPQLNNQNLQYNSSGSGNIVTTPDWATTNIASGDGVTFTIGAGQDFVADGDLATNPVVIASGNFAAYQGSGLVDFKVSESQAVTITGGQYTLNSGSAGAATEMAVTYNYSPVPEPSTYALFGIGALALFASYRKKLA